MGPICLSPQPFKALVDSLVNNVIMPIVGIIVGSVWNFALSSRFVWGRY